MVKLAEPKPLLGSPPMVPDQWVLESMEIVNVVVDEPEKTAKLLSQ